MCHPQTKIHPIQFHRYGDLAKKRAFRFYKHPKSAGEGKIDKEITWLPDTDLTAGNAGAVKTVPDARKRVYYCAQHTSKICLK